MSGPKRLVLDVTIAKDGKVSKQVYGVEGAACTDITKLFDEALGGEVLEDRKTSDYYKGGDNYLTNRV